MKIPKFPNTSTLTIWSFIGSIIVVIVGAIMRVRSIPAGHTIFMVGVVGLLVSYAVQFFDGDQAK